MGDDHKAKRSLAKIIEEEIALAPKAEPKLKEEEEEKEPEERAGPVIQQVLDFQISPGAKKRSQPRRNANPTILKALNDMTKDEESKSTYKQDSLKIKLLSALYDDEVLGRTEVPNPIMVEILRELNKKEDYLVKNKHEALLTLLARGGKEPDS
jgi:hypothetical protein